RESESRPEVRWVEACPSGAAIHPASRDYGQRWARGLLEERSGLDPKIRAETRRDWGWRILARRSNRDQETLLAVRKVQESATCCRWQPDPDRAIPAGG
ncbi:MAG: hypothetical protein ACYC6Y_24835, partial [Thermoguttaceae bacterium]